MPVFDYLCPCCEQKKVDVFIHSCKKFVKCKQCHIPMKRLFPNSTRFIGAKCFPAEGIFLEHAGPNGIRFYSKKEMQQYERDTGATIAQLH